MTAKCTDIDICCSIYSLIEKVIVENSFGDILKIFSNEGIENKI